MARATPTLSLNDWAVLGVLVEKERHGFAVARELEADAALGAVWMVPRPLVYRSLDHLVAIGYAEPVRTETGVRGPSRTVIRPTRLGRACLRSWLDEHVPHLRDVRSELLLKFTLLDRRDESLVPLAARQLEFFGPAFDGLAQRAETAAGPERLIALWRYESSRSVQRTLATIIASENGGSRP